VARATRETKRETWRPTAGSPTQADAMTSDHRRTQMLPACGGSEVSQATALARDPTGRPSGVGAGALQAHDGLLRRSLAARRVGGPRMQPTSAAGGFSHFHPAVGAVHRDTRRGAGRIRAGGADEPARGEGTIKELAKSQLLRCRRPKAHAQAEPPSATAARSPAERPARMNGKTAGIGDGRPGAATRDTRRRKTDGRSGQ
jgi:hypothetical protein